MSTALNGRYEVVHDRVAVRSSPSTKGAPLAVVTRGQAVSGSQYEFDGSPWLRLDKQTLDHLRLEAPKGAWAMIDGQQVGLGKLLRHSAEKAETAQPQKAKHFDAVPVGATGEHVVLHEKVVERAAPAVNAEVQKIKLRGAIVIGAPHEVEGVHWLKVESDRVGWMLINGASVGLGQLLAPATDIVEDIVKWAEERKSSKQGKVITWTAETEEELRRISSVAHAQLSPLKTAFDSQPALQEFERAGLLAADDMCLGAEGCFDSVLRYLLRNRAGVVVFGEDSCPATGFWSAEAFEQIAQKVQPHTPFHCRIFEPQKTQRVLMLMHGSFVRGDDLVGETEFLRQLLPDAAVVLPEAPTIVDADNELRCWWPMEDRAEADKLRAPAAVLQRLASTARWAVARFGGVPLVMAGFSQGAMLLAQASAALRASKVSPRGFALLSGLAAPFEAPPDARCLAIHGDADDRISLDFARASARSMGKALVLEEWSGLGHEITDKVLERLAGFCNEAAPPSRELALQGEEVRTQEAKRAKLSLWVKKISKVITMFDNEVFMAIVLRIDMVGLGQESPSTRSGIRYHLHNAGPDNRGMIILFHGMVANLRADTWGLAQAYAKAARLSVCVVDYKQQFSQLCVEAQAVLEACEEICGDSAKPIIVHGTGFGAIAGFHFAMAAQGMPPAFRKRLRLFVLDGAVSIFRALPPSPTGCIATDPIGNDAKIPYVDLPLCIVGGDDACCGATVAPKHYQLLSEAAKSALDDGLLPRLALSESPAVVSGTGGPRLCPELFRAVAEALDSVPASREGRFLAEVLAAEDAEAHPVADDAEERKPELQRAVRLALQTATSEKAMVTLWELRRVHKSRPAESANALEAFLATIGPDYGGSRELQASLEACGLRDEAKQLCEAVDISRLDTLAEAARAGGLSLDRCHDVLDRSLEEWQSEGMHARLAEKAREAGGTRVAISKAIREISGEVNEKRGQEVGISGGGDAVFAVLGQTFGRYTSLDPTLPVKLSGMQEYLFNLSQRIETGLGSAAPKAKAKAASQPHDQRPTVAQSVDVVVEHAEDGNRMTLSMPAGSTVLDVRKAIMSAAGEKKLSQVKLVKKVGNLRSGLPDSQKVSGGKVLHLIGRALPDSPAISPQVHATGGQVDETGQGFFDFDEIDEPPKPKSFTTHPDSSAQSTAETVSASAVEAKLGPQKPASVAATAAAPPAADTIVSDKNAGGGGGFFDFDDLDM